MSETALVTVPEKQETPTPEAVEAPEEQLRRRLDLLQEQVDLLQVQAAERRRPWYLSATAIISVVSILVATGSAVTLQLYQQRSPQAETLTQVVNQLAELRQQINKTSTDMATYMAEAQFLNAKRLVLLAKAEELVTALGEKASPSALMILAAELTSTGKPKEAEKWLLLGLKNAGNAPVETGMMRQALAVLYMSPGRPEAGQQTGREYWKEAVGAQRGKDSATLYNVASFYLMWAGQEAALGRRDNHEALLRKAQEAADQMPVWDLARMGLASMIEYQKRIVPVLQDPTRVRFLSRGAWLGQWRIQYPDPGQEGELLVSRNAQTNTIEARITVFQSGRLMEKYGGNALELDPFTLWIEWTGVRLGPFAGQLFGHTELRATGGENVVEAMHYVAGQDPVRLRLKTGDGVTPRLEASDQPF